MNWDTDTGTFRLSDDIAFLFLLSFLAGGRVSNFFFFVNKKKKGD